MKGEVSQSMNHRAVSERKHAHAGPSVNPGSCLQGCSPEERASETFSISYWATWGKGHPMRMQKTCVFDSLVINSLLSFIYSTSIY